MVTVYKIGKMKRLIGILIFLHSWLFCHLCHDPFIPRERLVLVPEKDLISIEDEGEFRIYLENTFRLPLRDFRLIVESEAFEIEVTPKVLEKLVPGERTFFLVKLKLKEGYKPGEYPLRINIRASEAEIRPSIKRISVKADRKIEVPPEPEKTPVKPKEELVREEEPVEKKPEVTIKEVKPEEVPEVKEEVVVRVERRPFWRRPIFYVILILILFAILLWRKLR